MYTTIDQPGCHPIVVDAGIADTLLLLWSRSYETHSSLCSGQAMIEFGRESFDRLVKSSRNVCKFLRDHCTTTHHLHTAFDSSNVTHTTTIMFDTDRVRDFNNLLVKLDDKATTTIR
jgi:hypothetical protein